MKFKTIPLLLVALVYVAVFCGYRAWATSTADSRPGGVPAWHFIYPHDTLVERICYFAFYPAIRIDQIYRDSKESAAT